MCGVGNEQLDEPRLDPAAHEAQPINRSGSIFTALWIAYQQAQSMEETKQQGRIWCTHYFISNVATFKVAQKMLSSHAQKLRALSNAGTG
jgi:hypothetical protein